MHEQHDALPCEPYQPYEAVHHSCLEQAVPELQTRATDASERQLSTPTVRTALSDAVHVSSPDQGAGHARTLAGLTVSLSVTLARQYQSKHPTWGSDRPAPALLHSAMALIYTGS